MVVLVREDNIPRLRWPIGVVNKLFPGKDGIPRTVEVQTPSGLLVRSIQRIHSLELHSGETDSHFTVLEGSGPNPPEVDVPSEQHGRERGNSTGNIPHVKGGTESVKSSVTRTGRAVRPRTVLDL